MGAIRFPNLGFEIDLPTGFYIGSFEIKFYGIILALGLIAGALLAYHGAKKTGQKVDDYIDFTFFAVIGAKYAQEYIMWHLNGITIHTILRRFLISVAVELRYMVQL